MKNIHILKTDKSSRLLFDKENNQYLPLQKTEVLMDNKHLIENQHIYITSDEDVKEGDWFIYRNYKLYKCTGLSKFNNIFTDNEVAKHKDYGIHQGLSKKIILTTDQDLTYDGVQEIDDEFLEWFVKNPHYEQIEVGYGFIRLSETDNEGYWVSIPNAEFNMQIEEPKQETTLEEAAKKFSENGSWQCPISFIEGAKWMQERMYSEEDLKQAFIQGQDNMLNLKESGMPTYTSEEEWFERFKKNNL